MLAGSTARAGRYRIKFLATDYTVFLATEDTESTENF
jgi:hypothetical protein